MKIYAISTGSYSEYQIIKMFINEEKAKLYCECHNDCRIEEYETSDDDIITIENMVVMDYDGYGYGEDFNISFDKYYKEETPKESILVLNVISEHGAYYLKRFKIRRKIKDIDKDKYIKVLQDMVAEIKYMISEYEYRFDFNPQQEIVEALNKKYFKGE